MSDVDWELLFRYLGQECTHDECVRVEQWLAAEPRHRAILNAAVAAAGRTLESMPTDAAPRVVVARTVPRRSPWALAAAASLVIAFGGTSIWRALRPAGSVGDAAPLMRTVTTGRGQRDTLRLGDGSRIVLGAASELRYPADFGLDGRDVYLVGEGYFEVAHDERRPFRVHASGAMAEDLGTAFGVRAYAEDSVVHVVVAEGKVAFGATAAGTVKGTVLVPGQLGRLRRGAAVPSVRRVDVAAYLEWTRGRLAFDDAPLGDVVAELSHWYHAEFRMADRSLAERRLTGTFGSESLPELLAALAPVLDVRFEQRGDTVIVRRTTRSP